MTDFYKQNSKFEVLTPTGWQDFNGITRDSKRTVNLVFDDVTEVNATEKHVFFISGVKVTVADIKVGDCIDTTTGKKTVVTKSENLVSDVYDLVEVKDKNHQYIVNNDIITKNCDELAYVRPSIAKEFWTSIRPTLSTGGSAIITSTPNSDEDQFALLWKGAIKTEDAYGNQIESGKGINGFKAYSADWRAHPERDEEWANEERASIGDERFQREHENKFLIFDETLINATTLIDLEGIEPIHKTGQVRWYAEPRPGMLYTVALDPSLGTGGDPAAIQVFEANTTKQIAEWRHNKTTVPMQIQVMVGILRELTEKCNDSHSVYYSVENNTLGEAALQSIEEYGEQNIPGIFLSEPRVRGASRRYRKGFNTTNKNKLAACAKLKNLVESKKMAVYSKPLITEFKHFVANGVGYAAKPGEHDDLVTALLLTIRMFRVLTNYHKELSTQLRDYSDEFVPPMPFFAIL